MSQHVYMQIGDNDRHTPNGSLDSSRRLLFRAITSEDRIGSDVITQLHKFPNQVPVTVLDLVDAATSAYATDLCISRTTAFDDWTRDLTLHLALRDPAPWRAGAADTFRKLIGFLTGDNWQEIRLRNAPLQTQIAGNPSSQSYQDVSLFSGGLDSFAGVVEILHRTGRCVLVGHHAMGSGPTTVSQKNSLDVIRSKHAEDAAPFMNYFVAPPKGFGATGESTTRGRSIIFLALGILSAVGFGARRLHVPENGFISLNVPLAASRLGSLSTRTTHPYTINLMRKLLEQLGIPLEIMMPYRFATKGELLKNTADQALLRQGIAKTLSCGKPGANRFNGVSPNGHCGYCVPCLIRRASIDHAYGADATSYTFDDLSILKNKKARDLQVIRFALARASVRFPTLGDVLKAGSLPGTPHELSEYLDVHRRGLEELRVFLEKRGL